MDKEMALIVSGLREAMPELVQQVVAYNTVAAIILGVFLIALIITAVVAARRALAVAATAPPDYVPWWGIGAFASGMMAVGALVGAITHILSAAYPYKAIIDAFGK